MARKRKQPPQPARSEEPPLKQQQQSQFDADADAVADAEAEYEEEVEEEHNEEESEEEEEESEEEDEEEEPNDETPKLPSTSSSSPDGVDDEPIQNLLEPLGKDEIAKLLCEVASKHRDVADRIRRAADADPAHRKIFVHGLGWDATAETLTAVFRQYGEIEDCKAVADKATGKSKGYGFILFKTRRGARNALREPQKRIGNRTAACQLASVGPVQPQAAVAPASSLTTTGASEFTQRKIYVSNVGAELDPQRLLAFFSRFGEIEEGPLGLDKVTGKPKGFCLFVYKSVEGAKRALEVPHKKFEGHILHCQRAIDGPRQQRMVAVQGSSQSGGFVGGVVAVPTPGHLMAPAGPVTAVQPVNPAIGQALTALLASRGAGLQLNGLLGIGSPAVAVNPGGYGGQGGVNPGGVGVGGYGNQVGLQGAFASQQQVGISGSGRGQQQQQQQYGVGQYGGVAPYMGH